MDELNISGESNKLSHREVGRRNWESDLVSALRQRTSFEDMRRDPKPHMRLHHYQGLDGSQVVLSVRSSGLPSRKGWDWHISVAEPRFSASSAGEMTAPHARSFEVTPVDGLHHVYEVSDNQPDRQLTTEEGQELLDLIANSQTLPPAA